MAACLGGGGWQAASAGSGCIHRPRAPESQPTRTRPSLDTLGALSGRPAGVGAVILGPWRPAALLTAAQAGLSPSHPPSQLSLPGADLAVCGSRPRPLQGQPGISAFPSAPHTARASSRGERPALPAGEWEGSRGPPACLGGEAVCTLWMRWPLPQLSSPVTSRPHCPMASPLPDLESCGGGETASGGQAPHLQTHDPHRPGC